MLEPKVRLMSLDAAILDSFKKVVGPANVLSDPAERLSYSYDATAMMKSTPGAVVLPQSAEQIAGLVALANESGTLFGR